MNSQIIEAGIITALKKRIALSTDSLCEWAGREAKLDEAWFVSAEAKRKIYRAAVRMERQGKLASAKSFTGKTYERIWRRM